MVLAHYRRGGSVKRARKLGRPHPRGYAWPAPVGAHPDYLWVGGSNTPPLVERRAGPREPHTGWRPEEDDLPVRKSRAARDATSCARRYRRFSAHWALGNPEGWRASPASENGPACIEATQ